MEKVQVKKVTVSVSCVTVEATSAGNNLRFKSKLVVGADGVHSIVARSVGLLNTDIRYTAVSQRSYVEGLSIDVGESAFFFNEDLFPGYGWMFPMPGGRANVGVGILLETKERYNIHVHGLFNNFIAKLKTIHPRCSGIKLAGKTIGGIVKTYGSNNKNYFDGGILVGDAGCFVDPMTGEGITAAIESSVIGASVLLKSLNSGHYDASTLSEYEALYRAYFDPALNYVDLIACIMRNKHFCNTWLDLVTEGCELAKEEPDFARYTGATFGGMEIYPTKIAWQVWQKSIQEFNPIFNLMKGDLKSFSTSLADLVSLQMALVKSYANDPVWHVSWSSDILTKWLRLITSSSLQQKDRRSQGLFIP